MFAKIKKTVVTKTFLIIFSLVLSIGMISGSYVYKTKAATICSNGLYCFGGEITQIKVCCNGLKVTVKKGPFGGDYMFTVGSMLYMWYNLTPGQCVTGDAWIGGVCKIPTAWRAATR